MADEREQINEEELPREGNSKARLYPPVEESGAPDEDVDQPGHGDAGARREGDDQAAQNL